jgi:endonuclease/exonuclease/phosphatase family metal-dependent hydrolase
MTDFTFRLINSNARKSDADTGTSHAWPKRRQAYADRLLNMEPDVLAFQELRSKINSDDTMSQVAYMESRLPGWQTHVMPESNVVTMVRPDWPITEAGAYQLPRQPGASPDYLTYARIEVPGAGWFHLTNHHVSTDDDTMDAQMFAIPYWIAQLRWVVSCGDWNVAQNVPWFWDGSDFGTYTENPGWKNCHHWEAQEKGTETDRILVRPAEFRLNVVKQKFTDTKDESDHNILFAEVACLTWNQGE